MSWLVIYFPVNILSITNRWPIGPCFYWKSYWIMVTKFFEVYFALLGHFVFFCKATTGRAGQFLSAVDAWSSNKYCFKNIEFWLWVQTFVFINCRIRQSKNNDISRFWCHHSGSKNKNFIRILKKHLVVISYISFVFFIECQWIAFFLMVQNHTIDGKMWWQKLKQYIMHYCLGWLYIFPSTFYRPQIVDQLIHVFFESHIK